MEENIIIILLSYSSGERAHFDPVYNSGAYVRARQNTKF